MRELTVIIPTWNMGRFLTPLFESIANSPFAEVVEEIVFVCEKSTDGSEKIIEELRKRQEGKTPSVRMIQPDQRKGLFVARYLGAKAARTEKIMFVDSRITLPTSTTAALPRLVRQYPAMISELDIDVSKNIFCLYWERSHNRFYRRRDASGHGPVVVDTESSKDIRVGGTSFSCLRKDFVEVSEQYLGKQLWSDDTYLMGDMIARQPFVLHPEYRINWEPRDQALVFLKHLYARGPGLAQYHFFKKRGGLFYATLLSVIYLLTIASLMFYQPTIAISLFAIGLLTLAASTALISESVAEFFRLAPLHVAVIAFYGFGALRGAWVVWKRG